MSYYINEDYYVDEGWGATHPDQYSGSYWPEYPDDDMPMDSDEPVEAGAYPHYMYYM